MGIPTQDGRKISSQIYYFWHKPPGSCKPWSRRPRGPMKGLKGWRAGGAVLYLRYFIFQVHGHRRRAESCGTEPTDFWGKNNSFSHRALVPLDSCPGKAWDASYNGKISHILPSFLILLYHLTTNYLNFCKSRSKNKAKPTIQFFF